MIPNLEMAINRLLSWLAVTMRRPVHLVPEPLTSLKAAESAELHLSVLNDSTLTVTDGLCPGIAKYA
jgi:hypothetical protein